MPRFKPGDIVKPCTYQRHPSLILKFVYKTGDLEVYQVYNFSTGKIHKESANEELHNSSLRIIPICKLWKEFKHGKI